MLAAVGIAGCGDDGTNRSPGPPPTGESAARAHSGQPHTPDATSLNLGHGLGAEIGFTIGAPQGSGLVTGGSFSTGTAWSTIKVPIALRVLQDAGGPDRISPAQAEQIESALVASDNAAAAALFDDLAQAHGGIDGAARAVTQTLREAGDKTTRVSTVGRDGYSPYGQTIWSLQEQARFLSALSGGCVGTDAERDYLLSLMGRVTSDTWGLGALGVAAWWKGGWGPGTDGRYLLRQMGLVSGPEGKVVVTLAVVPNDGRFESGQAIASRLARRIMASQDLAGRRVSC